MYIIAVLYHYRVAKCFFFSLVRNPNRDYCESPFNLREIKWKQSVSADISTSTPQKQPTDEGRTSQSARKRPKKTGEDVKDTESGTPKKGNKKVIPKTPNGPTMIDKWVRKETRSDQELKPVDTTEPGIHSGDRKLFLPEKSSGTSENSPTLEKTVLSTSAGSRSKFYCLIERIESILSSEFSVFPKSPSVNFLTEKSVN